MKVQFNFRQLIASYSHEPTYIITHSEGYFDYENGGKWVEGEEVRVKIEGAVTNLNPDEFELGDGGPYNYEDRKLYCYAKIKKGLEVDHKGTTFVITDRLPYEDFDPGLYIYYLKRRDRSEGNS